MSNKVAIALSLIVAVIAIGYVATAVFYSTHFFANTEINGVDCSNKSIKQVEAYLEKQVSDYNLTLKETEGKTEEISGQDISLKYVPGDEVTELAKKQNKFLWITSLWEKPVIEAKIGVKYDENALARRIKSLNCLKEENQVASVDAHPEFQNTEFVVVPEVIGTQIDTETFNKDIRESIEGFRDTLNLTDTNCYIKPRFLSDSQEVVTAKDTMNTILNGAKLPKIEILKKSRRELAGQKKELYAEYREAQRQMREAVAVKANIDHLLGITDERENKAQER